MYFLCYSRFEQANCIDQIVSVLENFENCMNMVRHHHKFVNPIPSVPFWYFQKAILCDQSQSIQRTFRVKNASSFVGTNRNKIAVNGAVVILGDARRFSDRVCFFRYLQGIQSLHSRSLYGRVTAPPLQITLQHFHLCFPHKNPRSCGEDFVFCIQKGKECLISPENICIITKVSLNFQKGGPFL